MEIDVELTNRQYKQIIEHCEQYHLDTKKYFGEKLLDGFYFEIYGDLNGKNRIKEEIKKDIFLKNIKHIKDTEYSFEFTDGSSHKVDLKNIIDEYIKNEKNKQENITVKITKSEKISETPSEEINTNEIKDSTPTPKKRVRRQIKSN